MDLQQRNILIPNFLDARSLELSNITNLLSKEKKNTKLKFQTLPKHLRRRAMSHNRYRIPSRIRKSNNVPDEISKIPKCRKHLRKPKLLLKTYQKRNENKKWLETHIWHSKRMKMDEYFGYKIAFQPNDKSKRACLRFSKHDAVMCDISYMNIVEIDENKEKIINFLFKFISIKDQSFLNNINLKNGLISFNTLLYKDENKNYLIGPLEILFKPNSDQNCWILIHPGCVAELKSILNENEVKFKLKEMNIFHILGPRSLGRVANCLKMLGYDCEKIDSNNFIDCFTYVENPIVYPKGTCFYLNYKGKFKEKLITEPRPANKLEEICFKPNENKIINEKLKRISEWVNFNNINDESIWESKNEEEKETFKVESRGRFTHKRSHKPKILKKKEEQYLQNIQQSKEISNIEIEIPIVNPIKNSIKPEKNLDYNFSFLFTIDSNTNKICGMKIFFPLGKGTTIFRYLSFCNIKVLGLSEYESIHHENGIPFFPNDFPRTNAYNIIAENQRILLSDQYFKKPIKHRPNFLKLNFPYPFASNWKIFNSLTNVYLEMFGKSIPEKRALICLPVQSDLNFLYSLKMDGAKRFPSCHIENLNHFKTIENYNKIDFEDNISKHIQTSRKIIGFVTSGDFCFNKNKGVGFGAIGNEFFNEISEKEIFFVLIRNPCSRNYFFADCRKITI